MSMNSRDVLFMMRARDYASREVRNLGGAFGALGKAIQAVDTNLQQNLNRSMERQGRMIQQNKDAAASYARVINDKVVASQKKQADAIFQSTRATERDVAAHKSAISTFQARNKHLTTQNALIRSSLDPQRAATEQARVAYNEARKVTRGNAEATAQQLALTKATRSQHEQLQRGTLTYQKYIQQRQAEAAQNREQIGNIRQQIASRQALGKAQLAQINTTAQREQQMLRDSAARYGEASKTHQKHLASVGAAQRKAHEAEAQQQREAIQQYQRKIAAMQAVGIAATITGALLVAMGRKGLAAIKSMTMESAEFQRDISLALTQIQNDTPATVRSLVRIGREIGTEIPAAMDTMGSTLFFIFSSLRVNTEQAQSLLRGFAKEAVAGNTDIESAARSTIAILNGMNLTVEDLTRVQDFQFQTVRRGVITYEQLANNLGKLIPALRRSGQEIETGGAMMAFLTRQGLSAEMAATSAARSLELIADPRVVNRLEDLGIKVRNARGEFAPLVDILGQMNDRIGNMPAPDRAQALLDIFGGAGYRIQARRFFDTVFANFDHFLWQIEEATNNAGAMDRAFQIVFDQPLTQMQLFQNNFEVLRQEMGDRFLPIVMEIVNKGLQLVTWFRNLDESTKDTIANFMLFGTAASIVTGSFLLLGGMFLIVTSLLTGLTGSIASAIGITLGAPAAIMALVAVLGMLALNYDDISGAIERFGDRLGINEEQVRMFATVVGSAGLVLLAFHGYNLIAAGAITKLSGALKGLLLSHPLLAVFAGVVAAVAGAIYLLGKRSREVNSAAKELGTALDGTMAAFASGSADVRNYEEVMRGAQRATIDQALAEQELQDVIFNSPFSTREIINGILNVNGSRQETLDLIQQEIDMAVEQQRAGQIIGSVTNDQIRGLQRLRDEYEIQSLAVEQALQRQIAAWKDEGGLTGLIAEYIELMNYGGPVAEEMAGRLYEQIDAAVSLSSAWGEVDPAVREALMEMSGGPEMLERNSEAMERQVSALMVLEGSWQSIAGVVDSVVSRYQEKLQDMNAANQAAADEAGAAYEDIMASLDLYEEAMNETTEELDWALDAQRELRGMYHDDVIAWWSQLYQDEPELAKLVHDALLEGDLSFYEQMRENRQKAMDFILHDINAHGLQLVDEYGNIHENVVEIVATAMGMHPDLVRAALEDSNVIAAARMGDFKTIIDTLSSEAVSTLRTNMASMSNEERNFHFMGDSWGRALINGINSGITNTPLRSVPRPQLPSPGSSHYGINSGGLIPGGGPDRDSVLAYLTTGEYVIRRQAVDKVGKPFLDNINALNSGGTVNNWPTSSGGTYTTGGASLGNWAGRFVAKYEDVLKMATSTNITATRDMISAIGAMRTQVDAQHALADAERNVQRLNKAVSTLGTTAMITQRDLAAAWEEAKKVTAEEELNIISAEQAIRSARREYERFGSGMVAMDQELEQLRQEERVAELTERYRELQGAVGGSDGDLAAAQARISAARLEMLRVDSIAPQMQDEVQALLLRFKAQNELADSLKALEDLQGGDAQASARDLRIAEIELAKATEQLNYIKEDATYLDEQRYVAELNLAASRDALTQANADAIGSVLDDHAHRKRDTNALQGGLTETMGLVKEIFHNRGVPIATNIETEQQRLTRIAYEVMTGGRTMDEIRSAVDAIYRRDSHTYDSGGILRPGYTLAYNGTGQNEHIFRKDQLPQGNSMTIAPNAINILVEGDADEAKIRATMEVLLKEIYDEMRSN
ncbi:MAG: phage tail tape measure protein [Actinobacteria bacterium]|nr:phage tail tape measure protein [Actinomycetota bacterium]